MSFRQIPITHRFRYCTNTMQIEIFSIIKISCHSLIRRKTNIPRHTIRITKTERVQPTKTSCKFFIMNVPPGTHGPERSETVFISKFRRTRTTERSVHEITIFHDKICIYKRSYTRTYFFRSSRTISFTKACRKIWCMQGRFVKTIGSIAIYCSRFLHYIRSSM